MGIDEFLAGLSAEQLEEVRTKALFLLRKTHTREAGLAEELYDEIRDRLSARGIASPPYQVFVKRSRLTNQFESAAKELRRFTDEHLKPRCKLERLQAYRILLRLVERRLYAKSIPLSFRTVLVFLPKVPSLIELSFPGYLASGLLPQVLFRRRHAQ